MRMIKTKTLSILNTLGLHVRAASMLSNLALRFQSTITVHCGEKVANAKSVLALLRLGAKKGTQIAISVDGVDEEEALRSLTNLIENRFGENE